MTKRLSSEEIDRILSGATDGSPELRPLAGFVHRMRAAFDAPPPPQVRERHVLAMVEAYSPPAAPARRPTRGLSRPTRARIALATACFVAATAALAAAGDLGPAQPFLADTVGHVGIDLPGGSGDEAKGGHDAPQGEAGKLRAAQNRRYAHEFTDAKKEWVSCVAEKAQAHDGPGRFDPEADPPAGCGEKPSPLDFREGLTARAGTRDLTGEATGASRRGGEDDDEGPSLSAPGAKGEGKGGRSEGRGKSEGKGRGKGDLQD